MATEDLMEKIKLAEWSSEEDAADVHFHYDVRSEHEPADPSVGFDGGLSCWAKLIGATVTIEAIEGPGKIVLAVPRDDLLALYGAHYISKCENGAAEDYADENG